MKLARERERLQDCLSCCSLNGSVTAPMMAQDVLCCAYMIARCQASLAYMVRLQSGMQLNDLWSNMTRECLQVAPPNAPGVTRHQDRAALHGNAHSPCRSAQCGSCIACACNMKLKAICMF